MPPSGNTSFKFISGASCAWYVIQTLGFLPTAAEERRISPLSFLARTFRANAKRNRQIRFEEVLFRHFMHLVLGVRDASRRSQIERCVQVGHFREVDTYVTYREIGREMQLDLNRQPKRRIREIQFFRCFSFNDFQLKFRSIY